MGASTQRGKRNPNWKGGRTVASNGYVLVRCAGHPLADVRGYVYEHRLVGCQIAGRILDRGEQVHHRNGVKTDNRPENLEVLTAHEHRVEHRKADSGLRMPGEPNIDVSCDCGCGERFPRFDRWGRPRRYVTGHNVEHDPLTGQWKEIA